MITLAWDCMLIETIIWSFLVYPHPDHCGYLMLKWLLFRVLFGFGKFHFLGGKMEWNYIRNMTIWMPMPTKFGLWLFDNISQDNIFWSLAQK